jgi:hypothetical protein
MSGSRAFARSITKETEEAQLTALLAHKKEGCWRFSAFLFFIW